MVSGNHIAADLSQSLAEQIRPSVDLAAKVSSGFSATPAIANMSALSQVWRKSLLPAQSSIADMIKGLTSAGSMPKPSDQLAAAMPSSIMPELYRGGFAARFAKAYDAGSTSKQAIKALAKVDMPPLTPTTTVPKFDRIYFTPAIDFASLFADTVPVADLVSELRSNTSDIFEGTRQHLKAEGNSGSGDPQKTEAIRGGKLTHGLAHGKDALGAHYWVVLGHHACQSAVATRAGRRRWRCTCVVVGLVAWFVPWRSPYVVVYRFEVLVSLLAMRRRLSRACLHS